MVEFETIPKEQIKLLLKAIDRYNTKCDFCEVIINENTYGLVHADVIVCNSILCQTWAYGKISDKEQEVKNMNFDGMTIDELLDERKKTLEEIDRLRGRVAEIIVLIEQKE